MAVFINTPEDMQWLREVHDVEEEYNSAVLHGNDCLLYTSPSPRD